MQKVAVIGGSSGIGLALIQQLDGCKIFNVSRTPCPVSGVINIAADVSEPKEIVAAFDEIDYDLDALVYCAGVSMAAAIEHAPKSDYDRLFAVNLIGAVDCIKYSVPRLKAKRGKVVLLSSMGGITPIAYDAFYSASKSALCMLSVALSLELKEYGITTTAALIGGTKTRFSFKRATTFSPDYPHLKTAADSLIKIEQTGDDPVFTAKQIKKILCAQNPPPIVAIGAKNKALAFSLRFMPVRLITALCGKTYNLHARAKAQPVIESREHKSADD